MAATPVAASASEQRPAAAAGSDADAGPALTVTLRMGDTQATYATHKKTVADFLAERGIVASASDRVTPAPQTPLSDGTEVDFRASVPVHLVVAGVDRRIMTAAPDVGALLWEQNVALGKRDNVEPQPAEPVSSGMVVRVTHETAWTALRRQVLRAGVVQRYDPKLPKGTTKTLFPGRAGERDITVHFVQREGRPIQTESISSRVVRHPRARIVLHGIGEYAAFTRLAQRGFDATIGLARSALHMIATAYTAGCAGCTGYAANGMRAGHGIVAVDPAVIPLGTRLYIPGYGAAIAGDTGGAIIGRRIDLGFNSLGDALQFGRRLITVFVLR